MSSQGFLLRQQFSYFVSTHVPCFCAAINLTLCSNEAAVVFQTKSVDMNCGLVDPIPWTTSNKTPVGLDKPFTRSSFSLSSPKITIYRLPLYSCTGSVSAEQKAKQAANIAPRIARAKHRDRGRPKTKHPPLSSSHKDELIALRKWTVQPSSLH